MTEQTERGFRLTDERIPDIMPNDSNATEIREGVTEAMRAIASKRERETRIALAETEWDDTPIVDIIWVRPPTWSDRIGGEMVVKRHCSPPPRISEVVRGLDDSENDGGKCEVQRVTRPLYEKLSREYELPPLDEIP